MSDKKPESVTVEFPIKFGWLGCGIYVALGILYHLIFGDGPFSWSDPWLYVGMFLWPFLLAFRFFLVVVCIVAVLALGYWLVVAIPEERQRKRVFAERRAAFEKSEAERAEQYEQARRDAAKNA